MNTMLPERWIWLDSERYPESQTTVYSAFAQDKKERGNYTVAQFAKSYRFACDVKSCFLRFSADTQFVLYLNGEVIATGPVGAGGDFLYNDLPRPTHYASELTVTPNSRELDFFALVKLMPVGINEYSKGHGGFMLGGCVTLEDGSEIIISTDGTWDCCKNSAFCAPYMYDGTEKCDEYRPAAEIADVWCCKASPLSQRTEELLSPEDGSFTLGAGEEKTVVAELEKIYAGFLSLSVKCEGELTVSVNCFEKAEDGSCEKFVFDGDCVYRGLQLHSAGALRITAKNSSEKPAQINAGFISAHYPVYGRALTKTSDGELNDVFDVCSHTLKICRQMMHLDSPRHGEPLACTGDYYIETLMTAFSFGDMTLSEFDVRRTAELLRYHGGEMFHTSYSLIWVQMLYDTYMFTSHRELLSDCADALLLLLERFGTYLGSNGLIETPPNYMFVDWIYTDGISLHHPPKALGQTCLSMFYYGALTTAAKIFAELELPLLEKKYSLKAEKLRRAVNTHLFDGERGLYFEGLNTPTPEAMLYNYMPQNTDKRYYRVHANILAVYFGVCEKADAMKILEKVMTDKALGDCQPYFKHFLLEAIFRSDLRDRYTLAVLNAWKAPVRECRKGLVEGFIPPEPSYSFDHSHAWGGTPLYSLPKALTGFEIIQPGCKKVSLSPSLLGLTEARTEIPTPLGTIICSQKEGGKPQITVPAGIECELR